MYTTEITQSIIQEYIIEDHGLKYQYKVKLACGFALQGCKQNITSH